MANRLRNIAKSRLKRDLIELEQEGLLSISAKPLDNNIFEWHVNIKPTNGVYSGVYFHLIMTFPESYPTNPPKVTICTPISHPNVFSSGFICLSMLRSYTGNVPYEGWSGAYSVTSVLMQLQSFLFAEKIDQDGGYQLKARLTSSHIEHSIKICKAFKCDGSNGCGHSHSTPWPEIKGPRESVIKIIPTDPESKHVVVSGSGCQTTHTCWVGARGDFGCNHGKVFYESLINWSGDKKDGIDVALCRFGFGTKDASDVCDGESFGYDCSGIFSYNDEFKKFGKSFTKGDTITIAVDFDGKGIYCAKNGELQEATSIYYIPEYLEGKLLFPTLSFKNSRVEFNFGEAKKPCKLLIDQGFKPLDQIAKEQGNLEGKKEKDADDDDKKNDKDNEVDWHSEYIIDELWLSIFESLGVSEVYGAQFVCKQWYKIINKYNIIDRKQICCYYTKAKIGQGEGKILGIGLNITTIARGHGFDIHSQMDILSLNAWMNGCRTGVWGEPLTHFLPLPMNKTHSKIAHNWIIEYLQKISKVVNTQSRYGNTKNDSDDYDPLQLVDTLISMMNKIVVQFSTGKKLSDSSKVSMVMCEKVVLGYCALHHLLLYLTSKHSEIIHNYANKKVSDFIYKPNGCTKETCKDLGKFLIYLLISPKYSWIDVADIFVKESFTRQVRWMVKEQRYKLYDTTKQISGRIENTFTATEISRRLIMFQVWFMQNNANETLKGYNDRLGRPKISVKLGIVAKTKQIINSSRYYEFFDSLGCDLDDPIKEMDQLLRFAVWDSKQKGYHGSLYTNYGTRIEKVYPPQIIVDARDKGWKPAAEYIEILEKLQKDGLREDILHGIYDYGWRNLSGIHEEAIIPMMNGNDIITQTQYGHGGIGTFCISSLQCIDLKNSKCQTLVLSPIRETAKQTFNVISSLGKYMKGLKCYLCVGGTSIRENIAALQKDKHVIIGTPGRVNRMISQGILKIDELKLFILDGADEMIAKGFKDQLYECFECLPKDTQRALFSATMTDKVLKLTEKFMKNSEKFLLKQTELSLDGIKQYYVAVEEEDYKLATLFDLYEKLTVKKAIIFVNSQRKLMWINNKMSQNNMSVSAISNEYSQKLKELEIKQFEQGSTKMLFLNDESLSLDINIATVQLVINYDLPKNNESYIHRVGRSGRRRYAKKYAINFVPDAEEEKLREIEAFYDISINELPEDLASIGIGIKRRESDNVNSNDDNNANNGNDTKQVTPQQPPQQQPRTRQRMVTKPGSSNDSNDWRRATPRQQPQYVNNYNRGRGRIYNNNYNNGIQERQIRPQTRVQRPTNNNYSNDNHTMQQHSRDGDNNNNGGQQRSARPPQRQSGMNNNGNNNRRQQQGQSRRGNNSNTNNRRQEQIGNGDGLSKSQRRKMRKRNKNNS